MSREMQFHEFKPFVKGTHRIVNEILEAAVGGFTKSGKFRCVAHTRWWVGPVHKGATLDRPGTHPFFILTVLINSPFKDGENDNNYRSRSIVTDLDRWCLATMCPGPDYWGSMPYSGYYSIRPMDLVNVHCSDLTVADCQAIADYIKDSGLI